MTVGGEGWESVKDGRFVVRLEYGFEMLGSFSWNFDPSRVSRTCEGR